METPIDPEMSRWLRSIGPRSRQRAYKVGLSHTLPDGHAELLFRRQQGCCDVTGLPFSLSVVPNVLVKHPYAPSLDRILSSDGYGPENVRLVCIAVNFGMGQWGQELYLTFAEAAVVWARKSILPTSILHEAVESLPGVAADGEATADWKARQREKIDAAQAIAATLSGDALHRQIRHLAALKRALTLGPEALVAIAGAAQITRLKNASKAPMAQGRKR